MKRPPSPQRVKIQTMLLEEPRLKYADIARECGVSISLIKKHAVILSRKHKKRIGMALKKEQSQ